MFGKAYYRKDTWVLVDLGGLFSGGLTYLFIIYLFIYLSIYLSIYLLIYFYLFIYFLFFWGEGVGGILSEFYSTLNVCM